MHAEAALVEPQRIDIGHQVAAIAVGRDQFDDAGVLIQRRVRIVGPPAHRLVGDSQFEEDLVEEIIGEQQRVDGPQEVAGFRALNDPMVVGRRQRDHLADAELGDALLTRALELRRQFHRAHTDDGALARHEAWHRMHGPDGPGVGQRDGHAREILGGEFAVASAAHDVLVGGHELGESHGFATLDGGDHQGPLAVFARKVDRQTEVGVFGRDRVRLTVDLGEVTVHVGKLLDRLNDRVPEQVGERDLAAAGALEMVVGNDPVVDHQLRRDGPDAGGGGDLQRDVHVFDDRGGGAPQYLRLVAGARRDWARRDWAGRNWRCRNWRCRDWGRSNWGRSNWGGGRSGSRRGGWRGRDRCGRCSAGGLAVTGGGCRGGGIGREVDEEVVPTRVDRRGVLPELAVHLLDQPLVLAEW